MTHWHRRLLRIFLSDTLLAGFALFMLFAIFLPIALSGSRGMILFESNGAILASEIALCVLAAVWAVLRLRAAFRGRYYED